MKDIGKNIRKIMISAALSGIVSFAGLVLKLWLEPSLVLEMKRHFDSKPLFVFRYAAVPVFAAAFAVFLLSLLSLSRDISFSGRKRTVFFMAGLVLTIPWLVTAVPVILWNSNELKLLIPWEFLLSETRFIYTLLVPFLSGACLFLGLNRK